ncbi:MULTISPECIES: hypothetical protein [Cetobacterium]|jgi:hypothetical protein|uniref:Metal-dependent hydrolase n=1 Tax=Candidatus Cetobacterium colombiensis TaxID=3073100 RepID=A0ABU4WDA7_9FUSO|nr:hypothetical protein [Candidatus Cetobacterium colombiensis]MDX8337518.1 hypothetical protein [Candidatus Cetobacterium colombiensis]
MVVDFTKFIENFESISFIGLLLVWMSFLIGIKFPDWDFKMKIKHRNILTHSPIILWIMIYFYNTQQNVEVFRFSIMGFALAIGLHMIFDFFPKGWSRGALIYFPYVKMGLGVKGSKGFIFLTGIYSLFLSIKYSQTYIEVILLTALGVYTIVKNIKKEEKFFRPFSFFTFVCVFLSAVKYDEISGSISFIVHLILEKVKILF